MQRIFIQDSKNFILDGHVLPYSCYFICGPSYDDLDTSQEVFKKILSRWASALSRERKDGQVFVFPFLPDDEWTEALTGTIDGRKIILERVTLAVPGFGIDFENLEEFVITPKALFSEFSRSTLSDLVYAVDDSLSFALVFDVEDFIEQLKNAHVINIANDYQSS